MRKPRSRKLHRASPRAFANWAEGHARARFAARTLPRIPKGVGDEAAILVSDNLATGWAAFERARLEPGESVAIIGGGAVGQLASLVAQACGASAVVVIEPDETRRRF